MKQLAVFEKMMRFAAILVTLNVFDASNLTFAADPARGSIRSQPVGVWNTQSIPPAKRMGRQIDGGISSTNYSPV